MIGRVLALILLLSVCPGADGPVSAASAARQFASACQSVQPERRTYEHTAPVRKKYYYKPSYRLPPPRRRIYVYRAYRRDTGPYHRKVWYHQPPVMHTAEEDAQDEAQSGDEREDETRVPKDTR